MHKILHTFTDTYKYTRIRYMYVINCVEFILV